MSRILTTTFFIFRGWYCLWIIAIFLVSYVICRTYSFSGRESNTERNGKHVGFYQNLLICAAYFHFRYALNWDKQILINPWIEKKKKKSKNWALNWDIYRVGVYIVTQPKNWILIWNSSLELLESNILLVQKLYSVFYICFELLLKPALHSWFGSCEREPSIYLWKSRT